VARALSHLPHQTSRLTGTVGRVLHRQRRVAAVPGRLHIELRDFDPDELKRFASAIEDALAETPGVRWAEVHAISHRLVVATTDDTAVESILRVVEQVEHDLDLHDHRWPDGPDHPADDEPLLRDVVGIGADLVGVTVGTLARAMRVQAPPVEVDLVAAANVIDQVLPVHRAVEATIGRPVTDLALGFGTSILQALTAGPAAPAVDLARRSLLLREIEARRQAWLRLEGTLFAAPPGTGPERLMPPERPLPLPDGAVESYRRKSIVAAAVGSGVTLALTGRPDQAVSVLQSALPKAATLGREGFAGALGCALAERGTVIFDPAVLRLLDRVDVMVVDTALLGSTTGQVPLEVLASAARGSQVRLVLQPSPEWEEPPRLPEEVSLATEIDLIDTVRSLQRGGHVVVLVCSQPDAALVAADVGLGVHRSGHPVPWGAALVASQDATDAVLLLLAVGEARQVVHDSVQLAAGGSAVGALLSVASLPPDRVATAPSASSLAGAIALADGYRRARVLAHRPLPRPADATPWHALSIPEVLDRLDTTEGGLTSSEALARMAGRSTPPSLPVAFISAVRHELANPLTPVLAAGAGLSAMAGSLGDAVLVSGVLLSNALIGGTQRLQADRAVAALLRQQPQQCVVIRDGASTRLLPAELVRGDVVHLQSGETVPADCRVISGRGLEVDESALTGESLPVVKSAHRVAHDRPVAERTCMLYEGTWVAAGQVTAVVVATGDHTEAQQAVALAGRPPQAGVEARLERWTARTVPLAIGGGTAVMLSGLTRGRPLRQTLGTGVSLAVAAVPEGLPLLATAAQLAAARRLARRNVLVRNARAIEALGRVDVLCADKTGTLTEGHIELKLISDGQESRAMSELDDPARLILALALRATPLADNPQQLPHPTDRAIARAGVSQAVTVDEGYGDPDSQWVPDAELPFEPARGFHAVLSNGGSKGTLVVKGAPEAVLPRCTWWQTRSGRLRLGPKRRAALVAEIDRLAAMGLRVLAVAETTAAHATEVEIPEDAVADLTLRGLLALADPARGSSAAAVADLAAAGVRTIMITGDHPSTARGIGVELGLLDGDADDRLMTGPEIDRASDAELADRIGVVRVYARVTPTHKVRIVRALQANGCVVAMTGDGANDAPAIRLADVGIALGKRGTAAAQSAADMVVLDDRIETLTDAIAEGRALWGAVRDAVAMLVGGNIGEIGFTVLGSLVDGSPPLNARQLLLVNMLTDALPALAIAIRRPRHTDGRGLLQEGPERSLGSALDHAIAGQAIAATAATTGTWLVARLLGPRAWARTVALATLVAAQLGTTTLAAGRDPVVLLASAGSATVLVVAVQTPGLSTVFGCVPLGPVGWSLALLGATAGTVAGQVIPHVLDRRATLRS
jgi:cation-transporting ATPase I